PRRGGGQPGRGRGRASYRPAAAGLPRLPVPAARVYRIGAASPRVPSSSDAALSLVLRILAPLRRLQPRPERGPAEPHAVVRALAVPALRRAHGADGPLVSDPAAGGAGRPPDGGTQGGRSAGGQHRGLRGGQPAR